MTMPRQAAGAPPFERLAQETFASVHPGQRYQSRPLTLAEKAEAEKAEQAAQVCQLCLGYHHMPGTTGCPRLSSFKLNADGHLTEGTFWEGTAWAEGRVVFHSDTKEQEGDG